MLKFFSIGLSCLVLLQSLNLDLDDLAHIDDLMEHAQFHAEKYGDNFFVFLSKHYGDLQDEHAQDHHEEQNKHEELPFNNPCCSHILTVYIVNKYQIPAIMATPLVDYSANFYYSDNYSFLEKSDIFQPPKRS
ncbi:hypothetical protein [Maribacter arenosus]|uniref:Uncharacterized protein n=1 Tax=Maribacter arenosus TaxID=1854708 RepID=A0ABR7VBE5_9FLAO|nr:hypothetical protein [Maribacter arenosus]MBD0849374.1 hypothetical protein [Maribacter arenosus]